MSKKETLHIYIRCSTDKQIDNSVERQKQGGIRFSRQLGMKHKIYIDGGKSRFGGLEKRDEMREILLGIKLGSVKYLWVEDWSRLTGEVSGTQELELHILNDMVRVYEGLRGNMEYQPDNTMERVFQYMKTMMGSSVKHDEIIKSISTKIDLHNQGFWMRGKVPYGYKSENRILKVHKKNSEWLKKIYEWYGNNGFTGRELVNELHLNGVKSPNGNDYWSKEELLSIVLRNEIYIGKNHYTDKTKDPHHSPIDKDRNRLRYPYENPSLWEVHTIESPRLISNSLWNKVQKRLNRNQPRPTKRNYLLHGKLKCECGMNFVGRFYSKYQKHYYNCLSSERKYRRNDPTRKYIITNKCVKPKRIDGFNFDEYVWDNLLSTLRKSSWIKERVKKELLGEKYGISSVRRSVNKDIKLVRKELKTFQQNRVQFIKDKYLNQLSDLDYKNILNSIDDKIVECESKTDELNRKTDLMNQRTNWINWLDEHHRNVDRYLEVEGVKEKRRVIDFYIDKVVVGYDHTTKQHRLNIHYKYPIVGDKMIFKGGRMYWDEWGKGYKIKEGEQIFSLSSSNFFLTQKNYRSLFNRDRLSQISRLVNITPS